MLKQERAEVGKMRRNRIFLLPWKNRFIIGAFGILILGVGIGTFFHYREKIIRDIERQMEESLAYIGDQNIRFAREWILDRQKLLRVAAEEVPNYQEDEIMGILKNIADTFGFYSIGIVSENGTCRTTLGEKLDLGGREYIQDALDGKEVLTEERLSENQEEWLNIFAMPATGQGTEKKVLTGVYRTEDFLEMLDFNSFYSHGGSLVANKEGKLIQYPPGKMADEFLEIEAYLQMDDWIPDNNESSILRIKGEEEWYLVCVQKIPVNDWSLLTYVREDYLKQTAEKLSRNILYMLLFLYLVILSVFIMYVLAWKRFRRKMVSAIFIDPLTGEWNEQYFRICYETFNKEEMKEKWVVYFDIDRFKMLNLLYGVQKGNEILKTVGNVFRKTLPEEEVFRCHQDIFVAVINGEKEQEVQNKLNQFQTALEKEIKAGSIPQFSLSFGICSFGEGNDLENICANAGFARQEAKDQITDKCKFYGDTLRQQMENESLEMRFAEAIKKSEFQVWYQPKFNMHTGRIIGAEALIRWRHQNGEMASPASFIPVFENTGQIVELDEEVLKIVCRDICEAREKRIDIGNVSMNLSKLHIARPGIAEKIWKMTQQCKIGSDKLSFEITESAVEGKGRRELVELVSRIQDMGFQVNMDDYGTGSSTLRSLADTHFDVLKLDRSFISLIGAPRTDIILTSTIHLAECLGMEIVAEGVETEEQVAFLLRNGCSVAQGYYFSKPLSKEEFFSRLKEGVEKNA